MLAEEARREWAAQGRPQPEITSHCIFAFFVYICFVFVILHQPEIKLEIKFKEKTKEFILLILQYPTECDSDSHSVAKPDSQGEKVIKSPCIGHFLISGKIIYIDLTLFHPGGGGGQTRIPVKNQWMEILIIFVYS